MALVTAIERRDKDRQTVHGRTRCLSSVFTDTDGQLYVQLDTFGSDERQDRDKVSQSIQFNQEAAAQLKRLIEETFPGLT
jgi:hypothetical protein